MAAGGGPEVAVTMAPLGLVARAGFSLLSFSLVFSSAANFISFLSVLPLQRGAGEGGGETVCLEADGAGCGWGSIVRNPRILKPLGRDLLLLVLFVVQHSVMATDIARRWTSAWFGVLQRSVYVLCTAGALQLLVLHWEPVLDGPELWRVRSEAWGGWVALTCFIVHVVAWLIIISIALIYDYAELMGVKQVYYHCLSLGDPMALKSQKAQRLYCHLRHPVFLEFLLVLWVVPRLTLDRLLLASVLSLYLLFGHSLDQQDFRYLRTQLAKKFEIFSREESQSQSEQVAVNGSR